MQDKIMFVSLCLLYMIALLTSKCWKNKIFKENNYNNVSLGFSVTAESNIGHIGFAKFTRCCQILCEKRKIQLISQNHRV